MSCQHSVLMIAYYFPPIHEVGSLRTLRFAKFLPRFGWDAAILAADAKSGNERIDLGLLEFCPPEMTVQRARTLNPLGFILKFARAMKPTGRAAPAPSEAVETARAGTKSEPGETPAASTPLARPVRSSWRTRLLQTMFCTPDPKIWWVPNAVRTARKMIRSERPDVIYTSGPPHSTHLAGLILNRLTGVPWVADFRDPWARCPWDRDSTPAWRARLDATLERWCVARAAAVILNTEATADEFARHYPRIPATKFVTIPNGFDPELQEVVSALEESESRDFGARPLRLCHAGDLYGQRSLLPIVEALGLLARSGHRVEVAQFGNCDHAEAVFARARQLDLEGRIALHEKVPHREALRQMARADILLAIQPGTALEIPGKIYEMMLFEKPLLVIADGGATARLVTDDRLGVAAPGADPEAIARTIRSLYDAAANSAAPALRRAQVEKFDGRALTGRLAQLFESVCGAAAEATSAPVPALSGRQA
jgi:glycosyltransferase involved in cell wall biosynthesis